ncbi:hypothetical protein HA052_22855 [Chromobacterium haemolyticum]|uniref:Phage tail protein n=1 Tax=Chromobacterium fluminis TaxID=3044269 RepID=A0ABX0L881_9NEIS|nr:hypothetical protein [Chromobacterium haemolyticum]NHR08034.1 hypothetical protein [Chromobacterium haemolyticum]
MSYVPYEAPGEDKKTFAVNGQFFWSIYGEDKFEPFAMVDKAEITISEETEELPNAFTGNGNFDKLTRVKSLVMDFNVQQFSPGVLAELTQGAFSSREAKTVSDEVHLAYKGAVMRIEHVGGSDYQLSDETGAKAYKAGLDYFPTPAGPIPLPGGAITDGSKVKLSYKTGEADVIEWLAGSRRERSLMFQGVNRANNKTAVVELFRGKFGFADKVSLLDKGFRSSGVKFECLEDPRQTGDKVSRWIRETYLK